MNAKMPPDAEIVVLARDHSYRNVGAPMLGKADVGERGHLSEPDPQHPGERQIEIVVIE